MSAQGDRPLFVVNAEAAIWRGDTWLVLTRGDREEHAAGTLALVGGKVEAADAGPAVLENAVRREVAEEVGLKLDGPLHYVTSAHFELPDGTGVVNVVFAAECTGGEPSVQDPREASGIAWMSLDDVREAGAPPWTVGYLAAADAVRRSVTHP
ncbi:NUDIX domain-containing protein [Streptomyces sp. bgisy091]|uniref:NUDIX domain-containing protein n=1 Tax=Streptomyces sp. bgisy091 TaxID=3413778 RepID=UPI003D73D5EF